MREEMRIENLYEAYDASLHQLASSYSSFAVQTISSMPCHAQSPSTWQSCAKAHLHQDLSRRCDPIAKDTQQV